MGLDQNLVNDSWINDYYQYEEGKGPPNIFDNLKSARSFWENELNAPKEIMNIVVNGYEIPFMTIPPKYEKRNNLSTIKNADFVTKAVNELLSQGLIKEVKEKPWILSPLSVATGDKLRLILDLSVTNKYIQSEKFCLEDQHLFFEFSKGENYVAKFDIKSCYHQIPINQSSWTYLGFQWPLDGVNRYFVFKVLPFGLTSGPYICKKLFKPLVQKWRNSAIKIVLFFDDGALCANSFELCNAQAKTVKLDLLKAHILPNADKSDWIPKTVTNWLGYFWNYENSSVSVSSTRTEKLFRKLYMFKQKFPLVSARLVAGIVGSLVSMNLVLKDKSVFLCRFLQILVNYRHKNEIPWDRIIDFSTVEGCFFACREVDYLIHNFETLNVRKFSEGVPQFKITIFGDASENKAGGYMTLNDVKYPFSKYLPKAQLLTSSTSRELYCVGVAMDLYKSYLSGKDILYVTDSQCTEIILRKGSPKIDLHKLAADIVHFCECHEIKLVVAWVPRTHNAMADFYSKLEDFDDWSLRPEFYQKISTVSMLNFTLDCFASSENTKCSKFYTRFYDYNTSGVDSLKFSWTGEVVWVVPPPRIAVKALVHFKECRCVGAFIVPKWTGQGFWAMLQSSVYKKYVTGHYEFMGKKYISPGMSGNNVFKDFRGILSVFIFDFRV